PSMYDVLVNSRPLAEVRHKVGERLWLAGSDINLAAAEVELAGVVGREVILRDLLLQDDGGFDFVFMDCAPSLGVLTLNALSAASEVFIPLQPHFLPCTAWASSWRPPPWWPNGSIPISRSPASSFACTNPAPSSLRK